MWLDKLDNKKRVFVKTCGCRYKCKFLIFVFCVSFSPSSYQAANTERRAPPGGAHVNRCNQRFLEPPSANGTLSSISVEFFYLDPRQQFLIILNSNWCPATPNYPRGLLLGISSLYLKNLGALNHNPPLPPKNARSTKIR